MNKTFIQYINDHKLFTKNDTLLLAVSGGVDSMVLLDLLHKNEYNFVVCYIDHDKRIDSYKDYELVKQICINYNIPFYNKKLDYTNIKVDNFQSYAREQRYKFFVEVATKLNIKYILTAHHLDDLAETIFLKLERGSNLFGYAGIKNIYQKDGIYYVKPLLCFSKAEIYEYSRQNNISYLEDSSNSTNVYKRNVYRNEVLPIIKKYNPQFLNKLQDYSDILFSSFEYIRKQSILFLNNKHYFDLNDFLKLDECIQYDVINYILEQFDIECNKNKIEMLIKILKNDNKKNIYQIIGNNIYMIRSYNKISFEEKIDSNKVNIIINNIDELQKFNNEYIYFSHNEPKKGLKYLKICYNSIDFPLELRNRQNGDYMTFEYGTKKLKNIFIDKKIDLKKRDEMLVVSSNNHVLWILDLNIHSKMNNSTIDGYLILKD